jgi:transposase-like protein
VWEFFSDDAIERCQRVDKALVAEMYTTGTSIRKVQKIAEKTGVQRLSKDQMSAIVESLDADGARLLFQVVS